MASPASTFDPGLTQQYSGSLLRTINKDGSFNIERRGGRGWIGSVYLRLVSMSWGHFLLSVAAAYFVINIVFALLYRLLGPMALHASEKDLGLGEFARAFFFSVHTLTTVGYGALYPFGLAANIVAGLEAAMGLMGFALATGLLYGRFSRPSARLIFSDKMALAPLRDSTSLQFRVANQRSNVLMNLEADMILMTVEQDADGKLKRVFNELKLERRQIHFLPLTWTIVHPIDSAASPLYGKTIEDLQRLQAEVIVLVRGFDDSFSQVVHSRNSYRWDEIESSTRFAPAFEVAEAGHLILDVTKVGSMMNR